MILRRLEIEAFGALRALTLDDLGPGLTVLYGPNEAGKSTLLAAVRWLLFGQDLRPPAQGGAAVRADVEDAAGRLWHVARRVTPRALRGSLSLAGPDGAAFQGEAALAEHLTLGTTWALYRSVFALGLRDLEEVQALDAPEVAGALFSAGAVGAADLYAIERALGAEAEGFWRPGGQKPTVNAAVRALGQARASLAAARADEAALAERLQGQSALAAALAAAEARARQARALAERIERACRALPAYARLAAADATLAATPALDPLPENLGERLALAEMALARTESAAAALRPPDGGGMPAPARAQAEAVRALAAEAPARQADLESAARLAASLARAREEERRAEREVALLAASDGGAADPVWLGLDAAGLARLEALAAAERALAAQAGRAPTAPLAGALAAPKAADKARGPDDAAALAADEALLAALRLDVAALGDRGRAHRAAGARALPGANALWPLAPAAALALAAAWALGRGDGAAALGAAFLAVAAALLAALRLGRAAARDDGEGESLRHAVAQASARLGGPPLPSQTDLELMAAALSRRRQALDAALAAQEGQALEARWQEAAAALARALAEAGLPAGVQAANVPLLGVRLEAWREARRRRASGEAELASVQEGLARYAGAVRAVDPEGLELGPEEAPARAVLVAAALARAAELDRLEVEVAACRTALGQLVAAAGAADPEAARHRLAQAGRRERALAERREAEASLAALGADEALADLARELAGLDDDGRAQRLRAAEAEASAAETAVRSRQAELDRLEGELDRLRRRSDLSRALEAVAQGEAAVADAAAAWAEVRLARWLLERAKARYEEERQPATLRAASATFARLTAGRYERVVRPLGGGDLVALRADGGRLGAGSLSQGTRAQLYLAMRLALAEEYARRVTPLPMVLDDVLVAFDDARRAAAVAALAALAADVRQVWLFTCHRAGLGAAQAAGARVLALDPGRPGEAPRLSAGGPAPDEAAGA